MIINTHDLEHDREADHAASQELRLEAAQQLLADDLFDGYMSKNYMVIDEVESIITSDIDTMDNLLKKLRDNYTMDGVAIRNAYQKVIACVCEDIAKRYKSLDKVGSAYSEYDL